MIEISSTAIVSANEEVNCVISKEPTKQRVLYNKFIYLLNRAVIGR